jgi:GIY-YIG catalytic domain
MPACPVYIYGLIDPITNQLRYVGKTIQKPYMRLSSHCCKTRTKGNHTECWIKSLIAKGYKPEMIIIDEADSDNWVFWEQFYISHYKSIGCNLTNFTEGGDSCNIGKRWKVKDSSNMGGKGKPIILNNEIEFPSVKACAKYLNALPRTIIHNLKNGVSYKGNILRYKGETNNVVIKKISCGIVATFVSGKIMEFENAKSASSVLNIDYSAIMKCLRGDIKQSKGYKFNYK